MVSPRCLPTRSSIDGRPASEACRLPSTTRWYRSAPSADRSARYPRRMERDASGPPLLTAELLSVGSELTVGDTRDTNAGELARDLTERGVRVLRLGAVPDEL